MAVMNLRPPAWPVRALLRMTRPRDLVAFEADHLVPIHRAAATDRIHRIAYRDIEGFQVIQTPIYTIISAILLAAGLIASVLMFAFLPGMDIAGIVAILILVFTPIAVIFLLHLLLGPTCRTVLHTPSGPMELRALSRFSRVRAVLPQIHERIAATQGLLPEHAAFHAPPPFGRFRFIVLDSTGESRPRGNRPLPALLFHATLVLAGLMLLAEWQWPGDVKPFLNVLLLYAAAIAGLVMAVRTRDTALHWIERTYAFGCTLFAAAIIEPVSWFTPGNPFSIWVWEIFQRDSEAAVMVAVTGALCMTLGLCGLALTLFFDSPAPRSAAS